MISHANRDRLVYPMAAILAAGLVTIPPAPGSVSAFPGVPRFAEVSAIRLQSEATSLFSGLDDAVIAELTSAPPTAAADSPTYNPAYTPLDNFVWNLPPDIRDALLPGLYAVAWVVGAVIGIAYLIAAPIIKLFNPSADIPWPAAAAPAEPPAPARSVAGSAVPGVTPAAEPVGADSQAKAKAQAQAQAQVEDAGTPAEGTVPATRTRSTHRGRTRVGVETIAPASAAAAVDPEPTARPTGTPDSAPAQRAQRGPGGATSPEAAGPTSSRGSKRSTR